MTAAENSGEAPGPGWARLLAAARRHLERTGGRLDGRIGLAAATDDERRVVIGLTGRHRGPDITRLTVSLSELDAGLRRARGEGLCDVLTRFSGPLRDRPAEAAAEAAARDAALAAMTSVRHETDRHETEQWYQRWRGELAADGTATRLVRRGEPHLLAQAAAVLDALPATGIPLPMLAEQITGDPKALSGGTLAHLVLRALALREQCEPPETAEQRRALWDTAGVVVDDLASQVLVLNLRAAGDGLGAWLRQATRLGVPLRVTLQQLTTLPVVPQVPEVFVCENPAVLRQATAQLGPRSAPLICTEGVPSLACWRLLEAAAAAGARIRWRNDFDWSGLRITTSAIERLGATPWQMSAADFMAALTLGDTELLRGRPTESPWDPALAKALSSAGRSIMEERLVPVLLTDLGR